MVENVDDDGNRREGIGRRRFLASAGIAAASGVGAAWYVAHREHPADVWIAKADSYRANIRAIVVGGLAELGLSRDAFKGKSVLLKPNLVEPTSDAPHINTHPLFIQQVAEAFSQLGAREVIVAEGPGHCRDTGLVLDESGVGEMLRHEQLSFVDLNLDNVFETTNAGRWTKLKTLVLPESLKRADWIVSLPKMKTHHWVGATLSMKNFFGVIPGVCYGWPKNVLHREGIHESILDIVGTVRPHLAIVDGIVGMEGDGPIMGDPKEMGLVVMGQNLPAVDATCCRLMMIDPGRVEYLVRASGRLGTIGERRISQRGEAIASVAKKFRLVDDPQFGGFRPA